MEEVPKQTPLPKRIMIFGVSVLVSKVYFLNIFQSDLTTGRESQLEISHHTSFLTNHYTHRI